MHNTFWLFAGKAILFQKMSFWDQDHIPAFIQKLMDTILAVHSAYSGCCIDDIVIFSETLSDHIVHINTFQSKKGKAVIPVRNTISCADFSNPSFDFSLMHGYTFCNKCEVIRCPTHSLNSVICDNCKVLTSCPTCKITCKCGSKFKHRKSLKQHVQNHNKRSLKTKGIFFNFFFH